MTFRMTGTGMGYGTQLPSVPSKMKVMAGLEIDGAGFAFKGALDDIRIYSRALNATAVKDIYDREKVF